MLDDFTIREDCDPAIEDCVLAEQPLQFNEYPARDLHIFAATSIVNAVLPTLYYLVSTDYTGTYADRHSMVEVVMPSIKQRGGGGSSGGPGGDSGGPSGGGPSGDGPRRGRGEYDDGVWDTVSKAHTSLWGVSTVFYLLTRFFNWFKPFYRYYIEHSISNLNYLVYLGSIVFLTIDAIQA